MMMDWNQYQRKSAARLGELMKLSPDTFGYQNAVGRGVEDESSR